jgi:hypothetical protein
VPVQTVRVTATSAPPDAERNMERMARATAEAQGQGRYLMKEGAAWMVSIAARVFLISLINEV